ncbi:uncharacterized protein H6S33_003445 [Morchella sextelata]|uniref:uncharacterized protein n=1 Tax=Morchella sextelata TaxID=1174677 RepID=UPI001D036F9C|nr:uncharacterized protein H6S33_003445 [Morchella sextelata]KAH0606611.1 hypothetical protein H6S33_003445 [Morchella sextelata]
MVYESRFEIKFFWSVQGVTIGGSRTSYLEPLLVERIEFPCDEREASRKFPEGKYPCLCVRYLVPRLQSTPPSQPQPKTTEMSSLCSISPEISPLYS